MIGLWLHQLNHPLALPQFVEMMVLVDHEGREVSRTSINAASTWTFGKLAESAARSQQGVADAHPLAAARDRRHASAKDAEGRLP